MATARPFGLQPIRTIDGNSFNFQVSSYMIPSADGSIYSIGDAVKSAANADTNGIPAVAKAVGTDTLRGVVIGVINPFPNTPSIQGVLIDNTITSIPATKTKNYYVAVADDPSLIFAIQDDGITAGSLVAANANKNFSLTIANPANPQQDSATVMLSTSLATTAGLNMKAFGLQQIPGNVFGLFAIWLCKINQHEFQGNTAGI